MKVLSAKFPDGYEGWAKSRGEDPVERVYSKTSYKFLERGIQAASGEQQDAPGISEKAADASTEDTPA